MWNYTTLEDSAFTTINGLWTGKSAPFVSAKVLRNTNFRNDGVLDYSNVATLDVESKSLSKKRLNKGDIIIERLGGGPKQPVGRVCLFELDTTEPFSLSNFTTALRIVDSRRFLPRFVCYYLLYLYRSGYTEALQRATTGIRNLDFSAYLRTEIPEPPINDQRAISAILSKIQQSIEVETNLIRVTRELKAAVMKKLFTEGLNGEPQKETEIGLVPESWAIKELGQVTELARGRFSHRPRNEPRFYGGQMPFIQTGDVVRSKGHIREHFQTLNDDGVAISRVFPTGTILITIAANIGYSGVLNFDSACPDSLVAITPSGSFDSWFLQFYLETQQPKMDELAPRGTQKNINIQFLQPWKVPIPVLSEQQSIAKIIQTVKSAIETHENKAEGLKELFQNLLCSLMSGTVSVPDLDSIQSCFESQGIAT